MSLTDFERADGLDSLTSEELEFRAFGPDPRRRSLRGLVRRPARAGLVPAPRRPRWRLALALGALALVGGGLHVAAHHGDFIVDDGGFYWESDGVVHWEDEEFFEDIEGSAEWDAFEDGAIVDDYDMDLEITEDEVLIGDGLIGD